MKNNWSLLLLFFLIDNRQEYCMDKDNSTPQSIRKIRYNHFYTFKVNDTLIDAFFNDNEYITCISQQGTAYPLNIKTTIPGEPYSISDHLTHTPGITINKIMHNREKKHIYIITNTYFKKTNKKNVTRMQDIAIIDYTQCKDKAITQFKNEIIHFVDPKMSLALTTPSSYKGLFITQFTNEYKISSRQFFGEIIKSIAIHPKKRLCALCCHQPDKSPMLRIFSIKTWQQLWAIPERAENLTFSHDGESIAYSSYQRVRVQRVNTVRTIETIIPVLAKITTLSYSKDGTRLQVIDKNPVRSFSINALTGAKLNMQEVPANPQPKKCFDKNHLFMAIINDQQVNLYQKVEDKL